MPAVDSDAISFIEYNASTNQMFVTFRKTGKTYTFCRVPVEVYNSFLGASSHGTFFQDHIRGNYDC